MSFPSPGAVGAEPPTQGIGVEFARCGCYYVWITFFGGAEMPRNPSPYYERVNRTFRGKVATCFHCRLTIGLTLEEEDPSLVFIEHYDVERYGDRPTERYYNFGFPKANQVRTIPCCGDPPNVMVQELCPGTGTKPIPLAHKFPDGTALPRYRYYRW